MPNRSGLTGKTAAADVDRGIDLPHLFEDRQRLMDDHLRCLAAEVFVERLAVDDHLAAARLDPYSRHRLLSAAGCVKSTGAGFCHGAASFLIGDQASICLAIGFCAVCGCVSPA